MLRIENLSKTYPNGVRALQDVSLEVPRGMFGLLGPNGAGKSTLMRTIATLQEPDSGSVTLTGSGDGGAAIDVLREKDRVRQVLGYLPQEFGVYPRVTAEALLDHFAVLKGITAKGERRELVDALLRQTNLWPARKRRLGTFSGGMRQRFGIAQALIGGPQLIIVDEPTAGLDPEERNRFLNLLAEIGENVVVILSTHIVDDVSDLCSRMAILAQGRLLATGEPRQVVEELAGRVWQTTVAKGEAAGWSERLPVLSTRLFAGQTILHVYSEEPPGEGFAPVAPDLEDVYFMHLRGHAPRAAA
jgi:ABC-type multidrug transport system ATPase subunit